MPTFSAMALDHLLESETSESVDKTMFSSINCSNSSDIPQSNTLRINGMVARGNGDAIRQQITDSNGMHKTVVMSNSPSSFPPSTCNAYRQNLLLNVDNCCSIPPHDHKKINEDMIKEKYKVPNLSNGDSVSGTAYQEHSNGSYKEASQTKDWSSCIDHCSSDKGFKYDEMKKLGNKFNLLQLDSDAENDIQDVGFALGRDSEQEDFFDPQESISCASNTDGEDCTAVDCSARSAVSTLTADFDDAAEVLSSVSGTRSSMKDTEAELHEIRLSLLMEIEKRKDVENTLNNLQLLWDKIQKDLESVGVSFSPSPTSPSEAGQLSVTELSNNLCRQIKAIRLVSFLLGQEIGKMETSRAMKTQMETKNTEVSRLLDRLHYYEAVSQEMTQRNQEAVEAARTIRRSRKRHWILGSVAVTFVLGVTGLAWCYLSKESNVADSRPVPDSVSTEHHRGG